MKGLTSAEVAERRELGLVNDTDAKPGRTYADIVVKNVFTPFNIVLFVLGILLLVCDEPVSAVSATGIIVVNILISTVQEMRAKHRLDRISLLTRPKVTVIRDGKEIEIDQAEVVKDDAVVLRAGDQAVVDGVVVSARSPEMDESLLSGESVTVRKKKGDTVYSGSGCVAGEAVYRVTGFGPDSYASQMLSDAKKFTSKRTPLQMETATVTKVLMTIAAVLFALTLIKSIFVTHETFGETLEVFVLCLDVVPIALFLLITLAYMIAAMHMADSGVLLQQSNSVESISHVNVVCMDKTGTITTNKLVFECSLDFVSSKEATKIISCFVTAVGGGNHTMIAIQEHYGSSEAELLEEIQFSSERKFSAARIFAEGEELSVYMGALTAFAGNIDSEEYISGYVRSKSEKGLRTVIVCLGDGPLYDAEGNPRIPHLSPISVISIRDELRHDCKETIQTFLDYGMELKILSGDDPVTVESLFRLAGIPGEMRTVSGPEIDTMSPDEFSEAVDECNIFGRMSPENKLAVIEELKQSGKYVAMIGDGVNDVRSLKSAQVGVSLESGAGAARGVAEMILINDDFSALPQALIEGRKTVSGMRDILKLYLTRNLVLAVLFVFVYILFGNTPMIPIQNTFYAFISVSIMAFFMTLFARPDENRSLVLPDVLRYCVPSAIVTAVVGLAVYALAWWSVSSGILYIDWESMASVAGYDSASDVLSHLSWNGSGEGEIVARTCMVLFVTIAGLLQIFVICPRWKFLSPDGRINKSPVPFVITALIAALVISMYLYFPWLAVRLIGFALLPPICYALILLFSVGLLFVNLRLLKTDVFKDIIDRFEAYYMKRLDEEFAKGDVIEETGTEFPSFPKRERRIPTGAVHLNHHIRSHACV